VEGTLLGLVRVSASDEGADGSEEEGRRAQDEGDGIAREAESLGTVRMRGRKDGGSVSRWPCLRREATQKSRERERDEQLREESVERKTNDHQSQRKCENEDLVVGGGKLDEEKKN
jgi:hypothetical protein